MAVTFTPTFTSRIDACGGSAILVKGTVTTTANDAVTPAALGFTQILSFLGPIVRSTGVVYHGHVINANFSSSTSNISLNSNDPAVTTPVTAWPSDTYEVNFIAL